jgi:hypothetical protein
MRVTVIIFLLIVTQPILAQSRTATSDQRQGMPHFNPQQPPSPTLTEISDADNENLNRLTERVRKLETQMAEKSATPFAVYAVVVAAFITALAAVISSMITGKTQFRMAAAAAQQARELQRQQALFGHAEKILEFKLKQMQQFYAPMFALLGQSKGLYDKMLYELAETEPAKYRWAPKPDPQDDRFQVKNKNGEWKAFRLLDQLPAVRGNFKAFALADRVLQIGDEMTRIIAKHAGLASEDLIDLLGRYMAHYAIISTIHKLAETEPYEPGWHKTGYFPRELDEKVAKGYRELSQFLTEYSNASKRLLEALPKDVPSGT